MPCGQKLPSGTAMAPPHTIVSVQVKKWGNSYIQPSLSEIITVYQK
jgi:hypothetical protein